MEFRIFVIASEAKQSLEILNSSLGNSRFILRNSRFLLAFRLDKSSLARKFYKGYALNPWDPKTPLKSRIPLFYLRFLLRIRWLGCGGIFIGEF